MLTVAQVAAIAVTEAAVPAYAVGAEAFHQPTLVVSGKPVIPDVGDEVSSVLVANVAALRTNHTALLAEVQRLGLVVTPLPASLDVATGDAAGGDAVVITGKGFQDGVTVKFGTVSAIVGAITATTIAVTTPAHAAAAVDVVVKNPGANNLSGTLTAAFTFA